MIARVIEDLKNTFTNNCYSGDLEVALQAVASKLPAIVNYLGDK